MSGAQHEADNEDDPQPDYSKLVPDRHNSAQSNGNFRISFIKQRESIASDSGPFFTILHLIRIILTDLSAGTMMMHDVLGITRYPAFKEFVTFLQVMEVFGSGYHDDIDYIKYNVRQNQTHKEAMVI